MQTVPNFKPRRQSCCTAGSEMMLLKELRQCTENQAAFLRTPTIKHFLRNSLKIIPTAAASFMLPFFFCPLILACGLRKRSENAVSNGTVDFGKIDLKGISADGYTLYKATKTVYTQNPEITSDELFDKDLADVFSLTTKSRG